jgi:hypothetical protein
MLAHQAPGSFPHRERCGQGSFVFGEIAGSRSLGFLLLLDRVLHRFVQKWAISQGEVHHAFTLPPPLHCLPLPPPGPFLAQRTPGRSAVWDGVSDPCGRD